MQWRDHGILLTSRRHGETSAIIEVFTETRGRHAGLVRGGGSRRFGPSLQPGTQLTVEWKARLEDHLGVFRIEPVRSRAAALMTDRLALAALTSAWSLLAMVLPEREPARAFYSMTQQLFDSFSGGAGWMPGYLQWELRLLEEAGHGLDLTACAVSGASEELKYVSPRSGRAVSGQAAGEWAPRLLPLPACMTGGAFSGYGDMADGLRLIGHFLEAAIEQTGASPPALNSRRRLEDIVKRKTQAGKS